MGSNTVVVLGAGVGGVVAAHRLRRRLPRSDRVVLLDRAAEQHYAPSLLWTLTGARRPGGLRRPLARLRRHGIQFEQADVTAIDTDASRVHGPRGAMAYDRLVLAVGAQLDPAATPGFDAAHNFYSPAGAASGHDALDTVDTGRIVVAVAGMPYKCPAAPWEAALLTDAMLRDRGVRQRCTIAVHTPEPQPMPVAGPDIGQQVRELLADRDIEVHVGHQLDRVEPDDRQLVFGDGTTAAYDVLLGVPAHRAPAVVADSPLAGPAGFVPVDPATLAVAAVPNVHAIGDITAIPIAGGMKLPKAGVFAHAQAEVVADRIADELAGRAPTATFDGHGACFLEVGGGRAAYATGDFYAPQGPELELRPPARRWHLAKVGLERYWLTRWWW